MKVFILILMFMSSFSHASEVNDLSQRMVDAYETELGELSQETYNMSFMAQYTYRLTSEGPQVSMPMFLTALARVGWPQDFTSCEENSSSTVCQLASESLNWYNEMRPGMMGNLEIKTIIFEISERYPAPLLKTVTISVPLKN